MKWANNFLKSFYFPRLSLSYHRTEFLVLAEDLLHWWGVCAVVFHQLGCYQTHIIMENFPALFFTYLAPEIHYLVVLSLSTRYGRDSNCLGFAQSNSLQPNTTHSYPNQILPLCLFNLKKQRQSVCTAFPSRRLWPKT